MGAVADRADGEHDRSGGKARELVAVMPASRAVLAHAEAALAGPFMWRKRPFALPPDPSQPVATDCLPLIRHIVVLMMENHSYDNYLGMLGRGDGLRSDGSHPASCNPSPTADGITPFRLPGTTQTTGIPNQS
jgi:phospholipase C